MSDHFAINCEVGLAVIVQDSTTPDEGGEGVRIASGTTLLGGAGFNYYF